MKTWIWSAVAGAAAFACYMIWRKNGAAPEARGRVRARAASRRKAVAARG